MSIKKKILITLLTVVIPLLLFLFILYSLFFGYPIDTLTSGRYNTTNQKWILIDGISTGRD